MGENYWTFKLFDLTTNLVSGKVGDIQLVIAIEIKETVKVKWIKSYLNLFCLILIILD